MFELAIKLSLSWDWVNNNAINKWQNDVGKMLQA